MNALEVISAEAALLAASARGQRPERGIPACPGLNLAETVRHVASGYRMALEWIRLGEEPTAYQQDPVEGQDLPDFLLASASALLEVLSDHDPEEPCATWWPAQENYGFWCRRYAHETTMHRMDIQAAAGMTVDPVADDVALDGIDEVLTVWFSHKLEVLGVRGTRDGSVAVRAGDDAVWLARCGPGGSSAWRVTPEEADIADAEVSASPMTMYRWLWGRLPDSMANPVGDHDAIAQMWALLRLATK
ncbi:maleylpyruvate isomerase family mycothiol-dependent enzyme [Lentzea tibetensis]|uniref:Maleylpyruvate isomerase family mycothiol-dependent enzyme n=1 Tax=Lentzea tibetensis TaxID=2591470 RepID=A0A563EFT4_9PSEU|nr:maleylpyruvate isomerase N-terminal domain-containing protein [Lentzea tibetensis]TWP44489.1 maleylpyruvate isomerase family mycothiol-dependent enzyme [Lentzea tibetensis]